MTLQTEDIFTRRKKTTQRYARANRQIRVPEIFLIGAEGEQLGTYLTAKAFQMAQDQGLDLVEVSPNSKPPVCKIMDYGKHKYELAKKQKEAKKHQTLVVIKEIKFRPNTDEHDFDFKVRNGRKFLEQGNKLKLSLRFRGREMAHRERGKELLDRVVEELKDIAQVEAAPKMEGRQMMMMLGPGKK